VPGLEFSIFDGLAPDGLSAVLFETGPRACRRVRCHVTHGRAGGGWENGRVWGE